MSLDSTSSSRSFGTDFAITLLALAVSLFFAAQLNATSNQKKVVAWQMTNGDKQITNIKANEEQLNNIIKQQGDTVNQVAKLEKELTGIFEDLLRVAEDMNDPDAQAIVKKYGIAKNKNAAKEEKKDK